jgi:hypothetical protein
VDTVDLAVGSMPVRPTWQCRLLCSAVSRTCLSHVADGSLNSRFRGRSATVETTTMQLVTQQRKAMTPVGVMAFELLGVAGFEPAGLFVPKPTRDVIYHRAYCSWAVRGNYQAGRLRAVRRRIQKAPRRKATRSTPMPVNSRCPAADQPPLATSAALPNGTNFDDRGEVSTPPGVQDPNTLSKSAHA